MRFLAALATCLLMAGCGATPTEPEPSCAEPGIALPAVDTQREMTAARDEVRSQYPDAHVDWNRFPSVQWTGCPIYVAHSTLGPGWYAGVTDYDNRTIVICTRCGSGGSNPDERTPALVRWEARNFFYIAAGHREQALQTEITDPWLGA